VWADSFGNERQKALWISYLIIATPLGTIIGYLMTAVFQDNIGWRFSFYI
jgi:MFS family permease